MVNLRVYLTELGSGERISFCQYTLGTVIGIGPVDVLEIYGMPAGQCSDVNADLHPETPVITMSMGALGAVSRLAGETFGSAMTFANPGQASAPGQVSLNIVNEVLDALHL